MGSDQASGNNCNNIFNEMKLTALFNKIKYKDPTVMPAWVLAAPASLNVSAATAPASCDLRARRGPLCCADMRAPWRRGLPLG